MTETACAVHFECARKCYRDFSLVVKDPTLGIWRGVVLTLLGPSRSGKSTCLIMPAGFKSISQSVTFFGDSSINLRIGWWALDG